MQNFLGVQGRLELPLKRMPDGVWFIQGHNGAGKSTLLEAVAWCQVCCFPIALLCLFLFHPVCFVTFQFNKFLRSEMKADYAVNDAVGQDCMVSSASCSTRSDFDLVLVQVRLDFANGVSIERFRNYSSKGGNGVKVFQNGVYKEFMDKGVAWLNCKSRRGVFTYLFVSGDGSRGSQDAIEEMLGIDFDTFARTVPCLHSLP